jgi:hypothetical protein
MRCEPHSRIRKLFFYQANEEPEKKENHSMEGETTFSIGHDGIYARIAYPFRDPLRGLDCQTSLTRPQEQKSSNTEKNNCHDKQLYDSENRVQLIGRRHERE